MQHIGQQQLLVLLLVLQSQFDQGQEHCTVQPRLQQNLHTLVNVGTVCQHLSKRRPREQPALGAWMFGTDTVVVGVEKHPERRVVRLKPGRVRFQHKGLKKPGGMRQMPFDRARVWHGLRAAILGRQRCSQRHRACTHGGVVVK